MMLASSINRRHTHHSRCFVTGNARGEASRHFKGRRVARGSAALAQFDATGMPPARHPDLVGNAENVQFSVQPVYTSQGANAEQSRRHPLGGGLNSKQRN
jgi:hypothetical protein